MLARALEPLGELWVVAPDRERSAISHAISLHNPLRAKPVRERWYAVDGTPTDCVYLALHHLMPEPPHVVVSGINLGGNLGNDVLYSGTVAAAMEGAMFGFRALAFSVAVDYGAERGQVYFETAAAFAQKLVPTLVEKPLAPGVVLNVNVPNLPADEVGPPKVCRLGYNDWADVVTSREDPRGRIYYWIGGDRGSRAPIPGSDYEAVGAGQISLTPVHYDLTDHRSFAALRGMKLDGLVLAEDGLGDEALPYPDEPKRRP